MTAKEAAPLLAQLSGEKLSQTEFREYVKDYANNPDEYEIDQDGDYFKAIVEAYDSRQDYWIEYCKFFDDPPIKDITTLMFDWKECTSSGIDQIITQLTSLGLHVYEAPDTIGSDCNGLIISKKKYDTAEEAEFVATPEFQIAIGDTVIDYINEKHTAIAVGTYEDVSKYDTNGAGKEAYDSLRKEAPTDFPPQFVATIPLGKIQAHDTPTIVFEIDWDGAHKYYGK